MLGQLLVWTLALAEAKNGPADPALVSPWLDLEAEENEEDHQHLLHGYRLPSLLDFSRIDWTLEAYGLQSSPSEFTTDSRLFGTGEIGHPFDSEIQDVSLAIGLYRPAHALEAAGIEVDYVRSLIRAFDWHCPGTPVEQWPWHVRIYVLGTFSVDVDDQPLAFTGRAPKKTLNLLKALVCLGGTAVRDHRLIDAIWPDDEADAAILHHVLHFAQQPGAAIREAARVLGDGGRLLIADFAPHDREELRQREGHVRLGFSDEQMLGWFNNLMTDTFA